MVQALLPPWMAMPATLTPVLKKSKMSLLSIRLRVFGVPVVPRAMIPLLGGLAPAGPMALFEIVLLLFPAPVDILNRILPVAKLAAAVDEPSTEQFVTMLFCAALTKRIVLVK